MWQRRRAICRGSELKPVGGGCVALASTLSHYPIASGQYHAPLWGYNQAARRSATTNAGRLVLARGITGIIEASPT